MTSPPAGRSSSVRYAIVVLLVIGSTISAAIPLQRSAVFKRHAADNPPKIKNEVAAFLESGRMTNDYVWIDVTTKRFVPVPGNDLEFGNCTDSDELIYFDNTAIENSGPSTLNGTLEIYIDAPVNITCVRAVDQIRDGTGGVPSFNSLGTNWVKIDVACQYGKGFHFHIYVYGIRSRRVVNAAAEINNNNTNVDIAGAAGENNSDGNHDSDDSDNQEGNDDSQSNLV